MEMQVQSGLLHAAHANQFAQECAKIQEARVVRCCRSPKSVNKHTPNKTRRVPGQQIGAPATCCFARPTVSCRKRWPVPFSLHGPWPLLKHRAYSGRTASCAISAAHGGPRFSSSKPYVRRRHTQHTYWGTLKTPIGHTKHPLGHI